MTRPMERLIQKPVAEWTARDCWMVRLAGGFIGFASLQVLIFGIWILHGYHQTPGARFQVFAIYFAALLVGMAEYKIRALRKKGLPPTTDGGGPRPR